MTAGYSGTPLAKKLSLKDGMRVRFRGMPKAVREEIGVSALRLNETRSPPYDAVHVFTKKIKELDKILATVRTEISSNGMIWVSWPKKASKVPTDVTEDGIRERALPMGLVDIKVCAVDAIWSGLKLVIRKELRSDAKKRR